MCLSSTVCTMHVYVHVHKGYYARKMHTLKAASDFHRKTELPWAGFEPATSRIADKAAQLAESNPKLLGNARQNRINRYCTYPCIYMYMYIHCTLCIAVRVAGHKTSTDHSPIDAEKSTSNLYKL